MSMFFRAGGWLGGVAALMLAIPPAARSRFDEPTLPLFGRRGKQHHGWRKGGKIARSPTQVRRSNRRKAQRRANHRRAA